ncbi:MAG: F0F1 ATP synthase subunit A [Rubripirellula sp.]|jgi:F-type H+-transporting ATPase subunit a
MIAGMNLLLASAQDPTSHVIPHDVHGPLFEVEVPGKHIPALNIIDGVYQFSITNHLLMSFVSGVAVILVFKFVAGRVRVKGEGLEAYRTRGRFAQVFETMCSFMRDEVVRPNLHELTDKYIYYIWTIFFFVLFANVLGLVPIGPALFLLSGASDEHLLHLGGTATGNLSLNVVLATGTFIAIIYIGIKETGAKAFFAHFNPLGWQDKKMLLIGIPLYFLEWLGLIIKCVVLAMRLFGTMMAGHLVLAAFIGLIFAAVEVSHGMAYGVQFAVIIAGIVLTLLELFICFLQAFIFTFLTVLFISLVASHHDNDHLEEHPFTDEDQMDLDKIADPQRITPMPDPAG